MVNKNTVATWSQDWQKEEEEEEWVWTTFPPRHQCVGLSGPVRCRSRGPIEKKRKPSLLKKIHPLGWKPTTPLAPAARQSGICYSGWGCSDPACRDEAGSTHWWALSQTSNRGTTDLPTTCLCCLVSCSLLLFEVDTGRQIGKYRSRCTW